MKIESFDGNMIIIDSIGIEFTYPVILFYSDDRKICNCSCSLIGFWKNLH